MVTQLHTLAKNQAVHIKYILMYIRYTSMKLNSKQTKHVQSFSHSQQIHFPTGSVAT